MTTGKYIVIEGPDGTGKTTQAQCLVDYLQSQGLTSRYVHEPGETPMGLELEKIIKNRELARDPLTDLLLFTANRLEVYTQVIQPALANGEVIVADRNWLSSIAYQGVAGGVGVDRVYEESKKWLPQEYIQPTFTILLYVPSDQHQRMLTNRGTSDKDYFESKPSEFQQAILRGYDEGAKFLESPMESVAANGSIEEVTSRIIETLQRRAII